jgi:magnesium-transporting ATPase (P-type)
MVTGDRLETAVAVARSIGLLESLSAAAPGVSLSSAALAASSAVGAALSPSHGSSSGGAGSGGGGIGSALGLGTSGSSAAGSSGGRSRDVFVDNGYGDLVLTSEQLREKSTEEVRIALLPPAML